MVAFMKMAKKLSLKKILLSVLASLALVLAVLGGALLGEKSEALPTYPTGNTSIATPLFDFEKNSYDKDALNALAQALLNDNTKTKTVDDLISYIKSNARAQGSPVSQKNITLQLGRTRNSLTDPYTALIWMPVYMSTTRDGNNAILTLYLATANGAFSSTEKSYYAFDGGNTTSPQNLYPSNMYGTSYIRGAREALANADSYYRYNDKHEYISSAPKQYPTYEGCNKYLDFLQYDYTTLDNVNETRKGLLYDDIVTPAQMAWQETESYAAAIGNSGSINNGAGAGVSGGGSDWANYVWPNDAYGKPSTGEFYKPTYFDYGGTSASSAKRDGYDKWKNDKLWLPSLTEVGTGDSDGNSDAGLNGLWKLNKNQRANYTNYSFLAADPVAWLRTADTAYQEEGQDYSTTKIFVLDQQGNVDTRTIDIYSGNTAIRPAIHFNLSSAVQKFLAPVDVPEVVTATYMGQAHRLDATSVTVENATWFKQGQMNVVFAYDSAIKNVLYPIDAGEYYMEVRLDNPSLRFLYPNPDDPTRKIVKFVIEKAKIGVHWIYDNNIPVSVEVSSLSNFYERDVLAGNIPQLGIKYKSKTSSSVEYYSYEELLKDTYSAEAYIINEKNYKYNYKLSGEIEDPIEAARTFDVGRKIITMPYVSNAGEGEPDSLNNNILTYTLSYRGVQYIQLENVSKYLLVSVSSKSGGEIECLNPTQQVRDKNNQLRSFPIVSDAGTLTYKVEKVDLYTFTFEFPNNDKFTWPGDYNFEGLGKETGARIEDQYLAVNIMRAKLDIEFVGLPTEWLSIQNQSFTIAIHGLHDHTDVPLDIMCLNPQSPQPIAVPVKDGVYTLSLPAGMYTIYASLSSNREYTDLYYLESGVKSQTFKVIQTVSEFNDNLVQWQYTHNGVTQSAGGFLDHDTVSNALVFDYDEEYYAFSLTISEATLRDTYYVKAVYSGSKFVKDSGTHCITVSIKAYYKNVVVQEKEYSLYYIINPKKYNLTNLKWDYDPSNPPVYDGTVKQVMLSAESLADMPGLTAEYITEGNAIDGGSYRTTVIFLVSDEYARNYVLPYSGDSSSYLGVFAFYCDWRIEKAKLRIEWLTTSATGDLLFAPVLKTGGEYVEYYYERKEPDGSWTMVETLVAEGASVTYRVGVTLKLEYANNYMLDGETTCEFEVESGKRAVSVHFEVNGETISDGKQFAYTGNAVELELVVDFSEDITIQSYTIVYYQIVGSSKNLIGAAPYDVGKYVAEVTAQYSSDTYISSDCKSSITFEIVKADFDAHYIYWLYTHGDITIKAMYDSEQEKWVDENGKEVIFSFEYDGILHTLTVECQQTFVHPEDILSASMLGTYSATNAGGYTAAVNFTYNSARYNDPYNVFPRQLNWTIAKQKLDYNNVRWGYITKDGQERDFNFDEDEFRYTRDEDGAVGYTVALIGLPNGIQNMLVYQTKNISAGDTVATAGNTRAAVGEYLTNFVVTGTWSDPTGNYEDFDAKLFPLFIPTTQVWTIKRRELAKFAYDGSWTTFDNRTHDILELSNIPYDELNYLKVEITYVNNQYAVDYDYAGYEGVSNVLYHAGRYDIRLYEMTTVYRNGVESEELVIWDTLHLEIDKAVLEISWDNKGAYPIACATNISLTDMITTVYYLSSGAEVPLAYVKSTNGEKFIAKAKVSEEYENDVDIVFADGEKEEFEFTYSSFVWDSGSVALDFPELSVYELEYTGSELTFEIIGWSTLYQNYLYISSGSLTQIYQGDYTVVLRFTKTANAYWKKPTATSEYNRDAYELKFSIKAPSRWGLDYPMLKETEQKWDNGKEIEFTITNWVALSKYVTYEVFYKNESLGENIKLYFRHGGLYTIVFTIPENSIAYWKENLDQPRSPFALQFRITDDPNEPITEIPYPELVTSTASYTGSAIQFMVKNWEYYSQYLEITSSDNVRIVGGTITAIDVGAYTITFRIKNGVELTFAEGAKQHSIVFSITPVAGQPTGISKPSIPNDQKKYANGEWIEFSIPGWASIYKQFLVITYDGNLPIEIDYELGIIKVKEIGEYILTLSFKAGVDAYWSGTNSTDPIQLKFYVYEGDTPPSRLPTVGQPAIFENRKSYTGKEQTFELSGITNMDGIVIEGSFTQKDVGVYTVILKLKDPVNTTWNDGTTADKKLTFEIVKGKLPQGSHVGIGDDGRPRLEDENGNPIPDFDIGDLFDVEYFDEDGNHVDEKDLQPGGKYSAKLTPNDKYYKSIEDENGTIESEVREKNNNGGFTINNYQPRKDNNGSGDGSGGDGSGGGDGDKKTSIWAWLIPVILIPIIVIIALIIVIRMRSKNDYDDGGYDDYGGGYDDDYDDDDDDDDYDDDYDDGYDDYYDDY